MIRVVRMNYMLLATNDLHDGHALYSMESCTLVKASSINHAPPSDPTTNHSLFKLYTSQKFAKDHTMFVMEQS